MRLLCNCSACQLRSSLPNLTDRAGSPRITDEIRPVHGNGSTEVRPQLLLEFVVVDGDDQVPRTARGADSST